MRSLATIRLSVSVLCAALVHGAVFGVTALVVSDPGVEARAGDHGRGAEREERHLELLVAKPG